MSMAHNLKRKRSKKTSIDKKQANWFKDKQDTSNLFYIEN